MTGLLELAHAPLGELQLVKAVLQTRQSRR
jgi:hypothetical protein